MATERTGLVKYVGRVLDGAKECVDGAKDCADAVLDNSGGIERGARHTVRAVFGQDPSDSARDEDRSDAPRRTPA
ncbi:hypothetical protein [Nocardia sp. BMG51109]|uniref:hypothetical protein n=1 Tax=Nocardia sp. BMG51109 TaxID=1056816 RepID=UPI000465CFAE|nr:hypothetical protein [Nocardia sp. BMG51109]